MGFSPTATRSWILPKTWTSMKRALSSRWEHGPANTLISVLWDPEQRTQLFCAQTSNLQKPWDNKWVLVSVTMVGVICYTAIENWHIHPGASSYHTSFKVGPDTGLFLFNLVIFSFFPTYFSHISPFLPLSSLWHFTNMLSSHASLSCFGTTVNISVHRKPSVCHGTVTC